MVNLLSKLDPDSIPETCRDYLKSGNKNEVIYRTRDKEADRKTSILISHAVDLYYASDKTEVVESEVYKILKRFFEEQTETGEDGFRIKDGKEISSDSLQNPTDPDTTYRFKYEGNIGYVAIVVESFNDEDRVITQYDLKQNIYSDQQFAKDTLEKLPQGDPKYKTKVIVDGTYNTDNISQTAAEKNIELIPTELTGKKPDSDKLDYNEFKVDASQNIITTCPAGEEAYASYNSKKSYTAYFDSNKCRECPLRDKCRIKITKNKATIKISEKVYRTSLIRATIGTEEYRRTANQRAGVEGIPFVLRRRYQVDSMPVRGLLRSKLWFGFKIAAMNLKSLMKWVKKDPYNRRILPSLFNIFAFSFIGNARRITHQF